MDVFPVTTYKHVHLMASGMPMDLVDYSEPDWAIVIWSLLLPFTQPPFLQHLLFAHSCLGAVLCNSIDSISSGLWGIVQGSWAFFTSTF